MDKVLIIGIIAALLLVGLGSAIGDSINVDLSAGPAARGKEAESMANANYTDAKAEQLRSETQQDRLDRMSMREQWITWVQNTNKQWSGFLANLATIFTVAGWIMGLSTAWGYLRVVNGAATGFNIYILIRSVTKGVAPVHQKRGMISSVFMPTANKTLVMHDAQPDIHTSMDREGVQQHQLPDPQTNMARAMASAHRTRSLVQGDVPVWRMLFDFFMRSRRSNDVTIISPHDKDTFN